MGIAASWETKRRNQDKPWSCFFLAEMSRPIVDFRTGSAGSVEEAEGVSPTLLVVVWAWLDFRGFDLPQEF